MLVCEQQFYQDIEIIRKNMIELNHTLKEISNVLKENLKK